MGRTDDGRERGTHVRRRGACSFPRAPGLECRGQGRPAVGPAACCRCLDASASLRDGEALRRQGCCVRTRCPGGARHAVTRLRVVSGGGADNGDARSSSAQL
eukprot:scaffold218_cov333-Prasinococcus_capsulatus_cf.AAC.17